MVPAHRAGKVLPTSLAVGVQSQIQHGLALCSKKVESKHAPEIIKISKSQGTMPWTSFPGYSRSEEHTSELQSLMRISYAVFCLKKKKIIKHYKSQYVTYILMYNNT